MTLGRRTKKNISNNPTPPKKNYSKSNKDDADFIKNLLNKSKNKNVLQEKRS